MAVSEVLKALGSWSVSINSMVPQDIWKATDYFGHVAIHAGRQDPRVAGDSLLDSARYVGVLREKDDSDATQYTIGGQGLAMWLGDQEGKGAVIEGNLSITNEPLEDAVRLIIPPGTSNILEGTYFNIGGPNFTGTFSWKTQREALNYLTDTLGADWKISGSGFLDVGLESNLFVVNPVAAVVRRNSGVDMAMVALPGDMHTMQDMNDFTTRVVLLADDGNGGGIATADADIAGGLNPFKDLHGNTLRMTRLIQETATDFTNAPARAQLQLNRFTSARNGIELSTTYYDIKGDVKVGDYIWVYDPDMDLVDNNNEVIFRGIRMNPMKLRLTELNWPIVQGMSVSYRSRDGEWFDLTDYVNWESGSTAIVVGGFNKSLSDGSNGGVGTGPVQLPNLTVPDAPTWVTPFVQGSYQSLIDGSTRALSTLVWTMPLNTDGSIVTDADYFEIRYRSATVPIFPVTHAQMALFTHQQLHDNGGTEGQPIQYPVTEWQYQRVPADRLSVIINELTPNMPYEAQVRLVDNATPANAGDWSTLTSWQTVDDIIAPSTPAAPEIAAGYLNVQVVHRLGKASGGTFNLEPDLHHFEVHGQFEPLEPLGDGTRLGRIIANAGMLIGEIPVVGKVPINTTAPLYYRVIAVDNAGNKSQASPYAVSTALLVDDAHISNLTVEKILAGTIQAAWLVGGSIATAPTGQRVLMTFEGLKGFDASNALRLHWDATDNGILKVLGTGGIKVTGGGNVEITDGALVVKNAAGVKIVEVGECADTLHGMQIYTDAGVRVARLGELASGGHGIEVIDEVTGALVKVSTLAFGTKGASVTGGANPVSAGSFVDLSGSAGPQITNIVVGNSGKMIVGVGAWITVSNGDQGAIGYEISGPTNRAASMTRAAHCDDLLASGSENSGFSRIIVETGLSAGTYTVTAKYRATNTAANVFYSDRDLMVIPF